MTGPLVTGEAYAAGLTPFEARHLTDEIRQTLTLGHDLLIRAYTGQAWRPLGYESWDAYCAQEFYEARMVRLDREQRREIVAEMRQAGMSTPAIGAALGVSDETARRDIHAVSTSVEMPTRITMTDGRERASTTTPARPTAARGDQPEPFTDRYDKTVREFLRVSRRFDRLHCEDDFTQHRASLRRKHGRQITEALDALSLVARDLESGAEL